MAHPDDAEILCGGTLAMLADAGWEVHIATSANGDCGSPDLSREEIAAIRREEARRAAAVIGGTYHGLGEPDVLVAFDKPAIRKAIDLFRKVAPTLVFTHPRRDYMMDHEATHLLARAAAFSYPIPNASDEPLVEGSRIPYLYYVDPLEGMDPYSGQAVTPTTIVEVTGAMKRKVEMLSCHASQREWLRSHHGMDEYIEAMKRHAAQRGRERGVPSGEAFVQHRGHAFPRDDLLKQLFG
jgi:LmbE family N-acetylglucosaminyl deacetylase